MVLEAEMKLFFGAPENTSTLTFQENALSARSILIEYSPWLKSIGKQTDP